MMLQPLDWSLTFVVAAWFLHPVVTPARDVGTHSAYRHRVTSVFELVSPVAPDIGQLSRSSATRAFLWHRAPTLCNKLIIFNRLWFTTVLQQ